MSGPWWKVVRRVAAGTCWTNNPNNNLAGASAYGGDASDPLSPSSFGKQFNTLPFTDFMFRTGNGQKWLIIHRDQVYGGWGLPQPSVNEIQKSHIQATP